MDKKSKVVYIIDDDQVFIFGLKKMITIRNLCENIFVFGNGLEAIEFMKLNLNSPRNLPDVILLDINMPIMDGWQFLEEYTSIKAGLSKKCTIYLVTSSVHIPDMERAKNLEDIKNYLVKPITLDDLEAVLS